jgi:hypothetical protein
MKETIPSKIKGRMGLKEPIPLFKINSNKKYVEVNSRN